MARSAAEGFNDSDPRAAHLIKKILFADMTDDSQKVILNIAQLVIERLILLPTKSPWRKEKEDPDWSRKLMEREVERTNMHEIAGSIKAEVDAQLGPLWHVAYGRSFACYVTHEKMSFLHFSIDGADVVVWKHGQ